MFWETHCSPLDWWHGCHCFRIRQFVQTVENKATDVYNTVACKYLFITHDVSDFENRMPEKTTNNIIWTLLSLQDWLKEQKLKGLSHFCLWKTSVRTYREAPRLVGRQGLNNKRLCNNFHTVWAPSWSCRNPEKVEVGMQNMST